MFYLYSDIHICINHCLIHVLRVCMFFHFALKIIKIIVNTKYRKGSRVTNKENQKTRGVQNMSSASTMLRLSLYMYPLKLLYTQQHPHPYQARPNRKSIMIMQVVMDCCCENPTCPCLKKRYLTLEKNTR